MDARLDHLVFAVPDLARGVADVAARTGVMPAPGGSHVGRGTANYLLGFGGSAYLEIIGPDPQQPAHDGPRPFAVSSDAAPRLATWAVRPDNLDETVRAARSGGYDPGPVESMSRRAPDGELLQWRLTAADGSGDGLVPFLIDWGTTTHPAARGLPQVRLVSLRARHPDPERIRALLALVGAELEVDAGDRAQLTAVLDGPAGRLEL